MRWPGFWTLITLLAISPAALRAEERQDDGDGWRIHLSPYAWLTGLEGKTTVDGAATDIVVSFDEFLELTDSGFQLLTTAKKGDWTVAVDLTLASLSIEESGRLLDVDVGVDQIILAVKGGYRIWTRPAIPEADRSLPRNHGLDLQLGLRYWDVGLEARVGFNLVPPGTLPPEVRVRSDDRWADLLVGAAYATPLSRRVSIAAVANLGGFGLGSSSRFTWEAAVTVTVVTSPRWAFSGGYRALFWDRTTVDDGAANRSEILLHGLLFGATFSF